MAPIKLVDEELPEVIARLRRRGVAVYGLTSRSSSREQWAYAWHNEQVVAALASHAVRFSRLPAAHVTTCDSSSNGSNDDAGSNDGNELSLGVNTIAGGILYAGNSNSDKAAVIEEGPGHAHA